jgi:hypothetical protein
VDFSDKRSLEPTLQSLAGKLKPLHGILDGADKVPTVASMDLSVVFGIASFCFTFVKDDLRRLGEP